MATNNKYDGRGSSVDIRLTLTEEEMLTCKICDKVFKSRKGLAGHVGAGHRISMENYVEEYFFHNSRPVCPVCGEDTAWVRGDYAFKKYCKNHANIGRSEWSKENGYGQNGLAGWKKGLTKEEHPGIMRHSIKVTGKLNPNSYSKKQFLEKIKQLEKETNYKILVNFEDYENNHTKYKIQCKTCQSFWQAGINQLELHGGVRCFVCNPGSKEQTEVKEFIESIYGDEILENRRDIISPKELDIYIPSKKLAIEYNGLHWHTEKMVGKKVHREKFEKCLELGINLLYIHSDEWRDKQSIVESMIRNKLGLIENKIFARKCIVKEISTQEAQNFLNANHLDGYARAKYKYGLFYKDELVSVITTITPRHKGKESVEIARFASKLNTTIVGGFSKLFKRVIEQAKSDQKSRIISYADLRHGLGKVYEKSGFKKISDTKISYWYTNDYERFPRQKFQADKTREMTENEVAEEAGVERIYGCGSYLYEMKL